MDKNSNDGKGDSGKDQGKDLYEYVDIEIAALKSILKNRTADSAQPAPEPPETDPKKPASGN
ncbi:MAG: hypothetical protein U5K72_15650 [Balneolaceae bacterium]|nr:hypothetical protein [Balneolaceae bacterium]